MWKINGLDQVGKIWKPTRWDYDKVELYNQNTKERIYIDHGMTYKHLLCLAFQRGLKIGRKLKQ